MKVLLFFAGVGFVIFALLNAVGLMGPVSHDVAWIIFVGGGGVVLIGYALAG